MSFVMLRGVRDICSSFNLTDELSTVAASLKAEAKRLTSSKARADADASVKDLLAFVDKISSEQPSSSQKGIAHCLPDLQLHTDLLGMTQSKLCMHLSTHA